MDKQYAGCPNPPTYDELVTAVRHMALQDIAPDIAQRRAATLLARLGYRFVRETIDMRDQNWSSIPRG